MRKLTKYDPCTADEPNKLAMQHDVEVFNRRYNVYERELRFHLRCVHCKMEISVELATL